jgi:hypothetical protein
MEQICLTQAESRHKPMHSHPVAFNPPIAMNMVDRDSAVG